MRIQYSLLTGVSLVVGGAVGAPALAQPDEIIVTAQKHHCHGAEAGRAPDRRAGFRHRL